MKCTCDHIDINGKVVSISDVIRYLGATLDGFLSMKQHIKHKCKIAMWNLYRIKTCQALPYKGGMSHFSPGFGNITFRLC